MARKKPHRRSRRVKPAPRKSAPVRQRSTHRKRASGKTARHSRAKPAKPTRRTQFSTRRKQDAKRLRILERELKRKSKRLGKLQDSRRAERARAQTAFENLESRLKNEQDQSRRFKVVIEDLTRPTREVFKGEGGQEEDADEQPFVHVPGEIPVRHKGKIIGYELPEIMQDVRDDLDSFDLSNFDDFDFDDMIDRFGDEENDSYGEDA